VTLLQRPNTGKKGGDDGGGGGGNGSYLVTVPEDKTV
jgi:hypothetical protein